MKRIILISVFILGLIISCNDDGEKLTPEKEVEKELKIGKNKLDIINSQKLKVKITGNAPYKFSVSKEGYLKTEIIEEELIITAIKGGKVMEAEKLELTITDSKDKVQKIEVNVYESLDVQSLNESINVGKSKNIILSSGFYDVITVKSDSDKIFTASKEIAQIGGQNIKVININAVSKGTGKITVTDGVVTKNINITCIKTSPIRIEAANPPSTKLAVVNTYNYVLNKDSEKVIYLFGGDGKFEASVSPKGAITTSITGTGKEGEYYLKLKLAEKINTDTIKITVSQKNNSKNTTSLTVKVIQPITFKYYDKVGKQITNIAKDTSGDDLLNVSKGDIITVELSGGFNKGYKLPKTNEFFKIKKITANKFNVTILKSNFKKWIKFNDESYMPIKSYVNFKSVDDTPKFAKLVVDNPIFSSNKSNYVAGKGTITSIKGISYKIEGIITIKKGDTMTFNLKDGFVNDYFYSIYKINNSPTDDIKTLLEIPKKSKITKDKKAVITAKNKGELILRFADWGKISENKSNYYYKVIIKD